LGTEEAPEPPAFVAAVVGTLDLDVDVAPGFDVGVALLLEPELQAVMSDAINATATTVVAIHRALPHTSGRNPNGTVEPP
jgi:hypothetical protein